MRIRSQVKVDEMQFGFMPGTATTDVTFIVRQMMGKHQAMKKKLYLGFVDMENAFDGVPRKVMMSEAGREEVRCGTSGDDIV